MRSPMRRDFRNVYEIEESYGYGGTEIKINGELMSDFDDEGDQ
jgi:hypothetical protein